MSLNLNFYNPKKIFSEKFCLHNCLSLEAAVAYQYVFPEAWIGWDWGWDCESLLDTLLISGTLSTYQAV